MFGVQNCPLIRSRRPSIPSSPPTTSISHSIFKMPSAAVWNNGSENVAYTTSNGAPFTEPYSAQVGNYCLHLWMLRSQSIHSIHSLTLIRSPNPSSISQRVRNSDKPVGGPLLLQDFHHIVSIFYFLLFHFLGFHLRTNPTAQRETFTDIKVSLPVVFLDHGSLGDSSFWLLNPSKDSGPWILTPIRNSGFGVFEFQTILDCTKRRRLTLIIDNQWILKLDFYRSLQNGTPRISLKLRVEWHGQIRVLTDLEKR